MRINLFKKDSFLFPFRWFIMVAIGLLGILVYTDATGYKIFDTTKNEKFTAGTHAYPIYHK